MPTAPPPTITPARPRPSASRGRPRLFPQVQAQIEAMLDQQGLLPGTPLASETELCDRFGVSRSVIRKVLNELTARKRLISIPGKGRFIADPNASPIEAGAIVCLFGSSQTSRIWQGPHVAGIAEGLQQAIGNSPHRLLFELLYPPPSETHLHVKPRLSDQRGAILVPLGNQAIAPILASLPATLPKVIAGRPAPSGATGISCVYVDQRQAMTQACQHLLELGHRQFGLIRKQSPSWAQDERQTAYQQTLGEADLPPTACPTLRTAAENPQDIQAFLADHPTLSALIVAAGDLLPVTLRAIERSSRQLGRDLSLLTWDDVPLATEYTIPITAIRQPTRLLGEAAAHMLLERLEHPNLAAQQRAMHGELILRPSVCSP